MPTILVLNSGSSSIKFSLWQSGGKPEKLLDGEVENIGEPSAKLHLKDQDGKTIVDQSPSAPDLATAFALIVKEINQPHIPQPTAIGHRMVCGGPTVIEDQLITPSLLEEMARYTSFAPLHAPSELFLMRQAIKHFPGVPNFVCLDSRFHRDLPEVTRHLPIPEEFTTLGLRRFGAHGLSYESIVEHLKPNLPQRLIIAHLGNGASVCAIHNGQSIDTSMGLTPTGGIISGSRTGDLDPGVMLFLLRHIAESEKDSTHAAAKLEEIVNKQSGLKGLSQQTSDMRKLRQAINARDAHATLAVAEFVYIIRKFIGAYTAILGGLDLLVFTGGIGEHDADTRAEICTGLEFLGLEIDQKVNKRATGEATLSASTSRVKIKVIPAAEDLTIVRHVSKLVSQPKR